MRHALCIDLAPHCKGSHIFNAIMASLSQAKGTWQVQWKRVIEWEGHVAGTMGRGDQTLKSSEA